ncbi:MAG TPA: FtsX-like permease family protein [Acidimicrobiales bacterium]|nr:FtsX-like permease family protein [Acidimicrobiales bacterium]
MSLLTFATAAALFCSVVVAAALPTHDGEFGRANGMVRLHVGAPHTDDALASIRQKFGTAEVIGHRDVPIPGAVDTVDFRDQAPDGVFGAPMLRLLSGRYPAVSGEIAMTRRAAADFHTALGSTVRFGGGAYRVVGVVENPGKLDDEFAVGTAGDVAAENLIVLVHGNFPHHRGLTVEANASYATQIRGASDKQLGAVLVLLLSTILLFLLVLVATASFAVIAHRRQRQLGMLASVGATDAQLRLVMLSNGVAVGVFAAIGGAVAALGLWLGLQPQLEHLVNHRMNVTDFPAWVPLATSSLAIAAATAASWWPARSIARVPVIEALSGRPPQPATVHRSVVVALGLLAGGWVAIDAGVNDVKGSANGLLLIPGALAVVVGVLVLSPIAIRTLARAARRAPLPVRLSLRDLNRYSARSGAALAAIALGLGIASSVVVVTAAAKKHTDQGNLSDRQLVFRTQGVVDGDRRTALRSDVDAFARTLGSDARVYQLDLVGNPAVLNPKGGGEGPPAPIDLALEENAHSFRYVAHVYVATPELLGRIGVTPRAGVDVVTSATGKLAIVPTLDRNPHFIFQHYDGQHYSDAPAALITQTGIAKLGGAMVFETDGWFVEAGHHLSATDVREARIAALNAGLDVEARDPQAGLLAARTIATATGVLLALALLGLTIGLIRSESGRDDQTLVAAGATSYTRRALSASTSGGLALLGSVLGIGGAYVGLTAVYVDRISDMAHPPIADLSVLLFGLPVMAAAAGWLLSGGEPVAIGRHALD